VKSIRVTAVVDEQLNIPVPALAEMHAGDTVVLEVKYLPPAKEQMSQEAWIELLEKVHGMFKDDPLEIPDDPPPLPEDFD